MILTHSHRLKPLEHLLSRYERITKYVSFDVETTGLDIYAGAKIFAYCIGDLLTGRVRVVRIDDKNRVGRRRCRREIQDLLNDTNIAKICHNYKFEYTILKGEGYHIPEKTVWHDTMLMSQLLQNLCPSHALDYLVWEIAGYSREISQQVVKQAHARGDRYDKVDKPLMRIYQKEDGRNPLLLFHTWMPFFRKDRKLYLDYLNEIELVKVTQHLEEFGVTLDWKESNKLIEFLEEELEQVNDESIKLLGEYVNFSSHPQVCRLLFKRFKYPIIEFDEETRQPSTDKAVILKLKEIRNHPVLDLILKYRSYSSALSMLRSYQEHADKTGLIHPTIKPNEASTGRQSSENPNMQNIRKGRKDESTPFAVNIRRAFRAKKGYFLCLGDYSAIEMKLIIEAGQSLKMINFMNKGINPHIIACNIFYGKHLPKAKRFIDKKTSKALYDSGKNAHFCLCYGGGPDKCAATMKLSMDEAMPGILQYQEEFPELAFLIRDIAERVRADGYVETPFGRKLYLPKNKAYAGLNYLIQGTAAGILKRAQVSVHNYLRTEWDDRVRMVLPIHDELIIAFPRDLMSYRDEILRGITQCMIEIPYIKVPLEVEWKRTTSTWDQAIPFTDEWHNQLYSKAT